MPGSTMIGIAAQGFTVLIALGLAFGCGVLALLSIAATAGNVALLQNLLRERVPIRDMETVLETLGDFAVRTKDLDVLTEYVRNALARTICKQYVDDQDRPIIAELSAKLMDVPGYVPGFLQPIENRIPPSPGQEFEWIECIKPRQQPSCNPNYHVRVDVPVQLSLLSLKLGRSIRFDPVREKIVDDREAARMAIPRYRAPWKFPAQYLRV